MKKFGALVLAGALALTLAACSNDSNGSSESDTTMGEVSGYTVDVPELDANTHPEDYPLIASADFEAAFENLKEANLDAALEDYQDVADIFGVDGAYYKNNDLEDGGRVFKYFGWYADNGVSVLITFQADGDSLKYYAYSGNGIN